MEHENKAVSLAINVSTISHGHGLWVKNEIAYTSTRNELPPTSGWDLPFLWRKGLGIELLLLPHTKRSQLRWFQASD